MGEENNSLATELLKEVKASAKRWFLISIIELVIIVVIVIGFLIHAGLPTEEILVDGGDGNANYIGRDLNGEVINGQDNNPTQNSEETSGN